jgi:tRNA-2-methylthio-N6-dimethylallyladenosine synthase
MMEKHLYIYTIGCQMNVYDSDQILLHLAALGYRRTFSAAASDLVVVNTCTIRAKAEQKAASLLGRLADLKKKKPGLIIAVGGCVAQQEGEKILTRVPHVDLVFGTGAIHRLPQLIRRIEAKRCRIVDVEMPAKTGPLDALVGTPEDQAVSRFVTIMRGCDNFCSYCVVPYVRGRESSRHPDSIIQEIESLVRCGVKEVTLLGQNVNSYGIKEGLCSFAQLLARVDTVKGLLRVRFTTSHPKDFNGELISAFKTCTKLCNHIHLPVQSGSNHILKRMNRRYTREQYLDKVAKLRDTCPQMAISSDIIVGFPGETETDFQQTLDLLRMVQFDSLFAFMYSDRPNAPSARFPNKVSELQKKDRLQTLLDVQEELTQKKNQALVGSIQPVLTEGFSKKQSRTSGFPNNPAVQWTGRTSSNKIVNFYHNRNSECCSGSLTGELVQVRIEEAYSHSLWGTAVKNDASASGLKGEISDAA